MMTSHIDIGTIATVQSKDGTRIGYLAVGSGPAVLVIPGALSVAADYAAFARALASDFTVYTIERRGRGESGPQGEDYSMVKECEDVQALQKATGASLLVGHSFGGLVALEAARGNTAFTRVAVYEPGVSIAGSIPMDWIPGYERKLAERRYLDAFVEFTLGIGPENVRKTPPWLMKLILPLVLKSHERQQMFRLLSENLREHREVARLDNSYENYQEIAAAVLLMYGGKTAPLSFAALSTVLPHSHIQQFPQLDHFGINKKAPAEVASVVRAHFLS